MSLSTLGRVRSLGPIHQSWRCRAIFTCHHHRVCLSPGREGLSVSCCDAHLCGEGSTGPLVFCCNGESCPLSKGPISSDGDSSNSPKPCREAQSGVLQQELELTPARLRHLSVRITELPPLLKPLLPHPTALQGPDLKAKERSLDCLGYSTAQHLLYPQHQQLGAETRHTSPQRETLVQWRQKQLLKPSPCWGWYWDPGHW